MHPRSLPVPPWFLALLVGLVAATLAGCESDRHHRNDDRDAPRGRFEQYSEHARPQGQEQGGRPEHMDHGQGGAESRREGPPSGPQSGPQSGPGNQGRQPESLLHRLEMGREAAREIGDQQAAEAMQRAVERTRQNRGPRDQDRQGHQQDDPRDGDRPRLDQLERRMDELMRAVEELRRDRRERKAV